jgi:hypothetical protein
MAQGSACVDRLHADNAGYATDRRENWCGEIIFHVSKNLCGAGGLMRQKNA